MLEACNDYITTHLSDVETFETVYNGDGGYFWNTKDPIYPSVAFDILSIERNEETTTFNYRVMAAARQHESIDPTTQPNYNLLYKALETAFTSMKEPEASGDYTFNILENRSYQFANLKLMDVCAVVTVDIQVVGYNECFV